MHSVYVGTQKSILFAGSVILNQCGDTISAGIEDFVLIVFVWTVDVVLIQGAGCSRHFVETLYVPAISRLWHTVAHVFIVSPTM